MKKILQALVAIAGNRVELLALEAREESGRWLHVLLLGAALIALAALTLTLVTLTIVVVCWEEHRLAALVGLSVLYLLGTLALAAKLRWCLQHSPSFSGTVGEIRKDQALVKS